MPPDQPSASRDQRTSLIRLLGYQAPQVWRHLPDDERFRQGLIDALLAQARWDANPPQAPTLFRLRVGGVWAEAFRQRRGMAEELAQALHWVAREAGLCFSVLPLVQVDPQGPATALEVECAFEEPEVLQGLPVPLPEAPLPPRSYLLVEGTRIFPLLKPVIHIGRRPDNDLVLGDPRVSRRHAQLRLHRGHYMLVDLNSTGGTTVNGRPVRRTVLYPGDRIVLAGVQVTYGQRSTRPLGVGQPAPQENGAGEQSTLIIRQLGQTNGLRRDHGSAAEEI